MYDRQIQRINQLISFSEQQINKYLIVLIANVKDHTKNYADYTEMSVESEFYSLQQYDEILTALIHCGFCMKTYFDELDFIKDIVIGELRNNSPKKILVINTAQKGTSHGRKSLVPAFCDMHNILYAGSDAYITSFARDKYHWYCLLNNGNLPVCESFSYDYQSGWIFGQKPKIGTKVITKLNHESSSIGLTANNIFEYDYDADKFIHELSTRYEQRVIVQHFISGCEVEVPAIASKNGVYSLIPAGISIEHNKILGNSILDYSIRGDHLFEFYDYCKYNLQSAQELMKMAETVASVMNMKGLVRVDFRIEENGKYWITDVSSSPHFTKSMTFWHAYQALGYEYSDVLKTIIGLAVEEDTMDMSNMIVYEERMPTPSEWGSLRAALGWTVHSNQDFIDASGYTLYSVCAISAKDGVVGFGRVVGDARLCFYIHDVGVLPYHQGCGIGKEIITKLLEYIRAHAANNAYVALIASHGKEGFYEQFGFIAKSKESSGSGMVLTIDPS